MAKEMVMERKAMPVWCGLEHLDAVAEQVKAGTWVQPKAGLVMNDDLVFLEQPIEIDPVAKLAKTQGNYRPPIIISSFPDIWENLGLEYPVLEQPLATKYTWIEVAKSKPDYDALSNSLKGLKL